MKLKDLPKVDLPREKLEKYGAQKMKDHELLAIILSSGIKGVNVLKLSEKILRTIKKKGAQKISLEDLLEIKGLGKAIDSSVELRNKKDLIQQFIASLDIQSSVDKDWQTFVESEKIKNLDQIINDEDLDKDETYAFIQNAFRDGTVSTIGTGITNILPPTSMFSPDGERTKKRETVIRKLKLFFEKFFDISRRDF